MQREVERVFNCCSVEKSMLYRFLGISKILEVNFNRLCVRRVFKCQFLNFKRFTLDNVSDVRYPAVKSEVRLRNSSKSGVRFTQILEVTFNRLGKVRSTSSLNVGAYKKSIFYHFLVISGRRSMSEL